MASPAPHPHRQGPRPLPLHMNLSLGSWLSSAPALLLSNSSSLPWLDPELQNLAARLGQHSPSELAPSLARNVGHKLSQFLAGITRYQQHPYRRSLKDPPVIWQEGSSRLLDYGGKGPPVLFVPSLVNKAYILDLDRRRSLLRWLAGQGLRPLLLDWGHPGETERDFSLDSYVNRASRALLHIRQPVRLAGYCMGGLLALSLAQQQPERINRIALLATPWDFHAGDRAAALRTAALFRLWQPGCRLLGELPVDLIQTLFTLLDPFGPQQKFLRFAELTDDDEVESFVALEDWLNDGIPLSYPVAETCLVNWYERNEAAQFADPGQVRMPALVMIPTQDKIVRPESAEALAAQLPDCRRLRVPLGHIGMIVSRHAQREVWQPLAEWLRAVP